LPRQGSLKNVFKNNNLAGRCHSHFAPQAAWILDLGFSGVKHTPINTPKSVLLPKKRGEITTAWPLPKTARHQAVSIHCIKFARTFMQVQSLVFSVPPHF
jgi:hypothetical protein